MHLQEGVEGNRTREEGMCGLQVDLHDPSRIKKSGASSTPCVAAPAKLPTPTATLLRTSQTQTRGFAHGSLPSWAPASKPVWKASEMPQLLRASALRALTWLHRLHRFYIRKLGADPPAVQASCVSKGICKVSSSKIVGSTSSEMI